MRVAIASALALTGCTAVLGIAEPTSAEFDLRAALVPVMAPTDPYLAFDLVVTNIGPDAVIDHIEIELELPQDAFLGAGSSTLCGSNPATPTVGGCTLNGMAGGASQRHRLLVLPANGTLRATIVTPEDIDDGNNTAAIELTGSADLEVRPLLDGFTTDIAPGSEHGYTFRVRNNGPGWARDVRLDITAPGFTPQSAMGIQWSCTPTSCTLAMLPPGTDAYSLRWIALAPTTAGAVFVRGTATSTVPDPNSGNSSTMYSQTVVP